MERYSETRKRRRDHCERGRVHAAARHGDRAGYRVSFGHRPNLRAGHAGSLRDFEKRGATVGSIPRPPRKTPLYARR